MDSISIHNYNQKYMQYIVQLNYLGVIFLIKKQLGDDTFNGIELYYSSIGRTMDRHDKHGSKRVCLLKVTQLWTVYELLFIGYSPTEFTIVEP